MYQLDGKVVEYQTVIEKVMDAIESNAPVYYAFHLGVDIFWIEDVAPSWSSEIFLSNEGLVDGNSKLIEPLEEKGKWTLLCDGVGMLWTP